MILLDGENLKNARFCVAIVIKMYRDQPIPPKFARLWRQLHPETDLSARGHENLPSTDESETVSSVEAAVLVNKPERWVRRHPSELGGRKHGDRWRYSRATIARYLREREDN